MKKHFVKNVDALGEHHGAVYLPTQLYKESSDPHALIEARRKSSERRLLQHRERLVADTEGVLLTLAGAWAAASIKRARAAQDPDKKENDDVAPMRQRRPEAA